MKNSTIVNMESKFEVCSEDGKLVATYQHEGPAYTHADAENLLVFDHQICAYTDSSGAVVPDPFFMLRSIDGRSSL